MRNDFIGGSEIELTYTECQAELDPSGKSEDSEF